MNSLIFVSLALFAAEPAPVAVSDPGTLLIQGVYPYETTYFALDPGLAEDTPINAKFQISFAFRIGGTAPRVDHRRPDGLYAAYSQTSFWDLESDSKPFYDTSYRPELWWHVDLPGGDVANRLALEPGIGHESNGKKDADSRSLNHLFLRGLGEWTSGDVLLTASPRVRAYLEKSDNPDLPRYRGYFDLVGSAALTNSWGLAATGRIGDHVDRGSLMLEATHPMAPWTGEWMRGYLYIQSFIGWSETLLRYDAKSEQPRILIGFAVTR